MYIHHIFAPFLHYRSLFWSLQDKTGRLVIWMRTGHVPWWRSLFERTDEALRAQLWAGEWIYAQQAQLAKLTGAPWCRFCWKSCGQNGPKSLVFPWRMLGLKMLKNVEPIIRWNWVWVKLLGQHCEPVKWGGHQQIWLNSNVSSQRVETSCRSDSELSSHCQAYGMSARWCWWTWVTWISTTSRVYPAAVVRGAVGHNTPPRSIILEWWIRPTFCTRRVLRVRLGVSWSTSFRRNWWTRPEEGVQMQMPEIIGLQI